MKTAALNVSDLSADPANLRQHDERSIAAIVASLRRWGQQKPIVVDVGNVVIAGNGTLEAARRLGWKRIQAVRSKLSGPDRIGYAIADNRSAELSTWDRPALLATLKAMAPDEVGTLGFDLADLDGSMQDDAAVSIAEGRPPVTRKGDLWALGPHRLLCGDSTLPADVDRVMNGNHAALVSTDPPYLVDYTGKRGSGKGKDWSKLYHEIEVQDSAAFYRALFVNVLAVAGDHAPIYCWHADRRAAEIVALWKELGILHHQTVIWVKPGPVFGPSLWHWRHEPCLVGWRQGSPPKHDGKHGADTVWSDVGDDLSQMTQVQLLAVIDRLVSCWHVAFDAKGKNVDNEHPTQKPLELFARPMRKHTKPGDICFEPFSGSGSQIIAAEKCGRACYAIEIEPVFVDVAIRRWQQLTGRDATRDGKAWRRVAAARKVKT